jgi:ribosomal protein S20
VNWKSFGMKAMLVFGLVVGIGFGYIAQGAVVSAQTPTTPSQSTPPANGLWEGFLNKLAAALGIDRTALDAAMLSAGTDTANEAVQQGTLTQEQADRAIDRMQNGDYGFAFGRGRGGPGRGGPVVDGLREAMVNAAASELGITADELRTALRDGQTIAELAAANNTTEQAVVDAALAAAKTKLDEAVAAGTITQAQADEIYAKLEARGANILNHEGRGRGGRGPGAPDTAPTAEPTTGTGA